MISCQFFCIIGHPDGVRVWKQYEYSSALILILILRIFLKRCPASQQSKPSLTLGSFPIVHYYSLSWSVIYSLNKTASEYWHV